MGGVQDVVLCLLWSTVAPEEIALPHALASMRSQFICALKDRQQLMRRVFGDAKGREGRATARLSGSLGIFRAPVGFSGGGVPIQVGLSVAASACCP